MAKRTKEELEIIKNFTDGTYSRFGNMLLVNTEKPYDPMHSELGYCYKYKDPISGNTTYKIICSKIGIPDTDFRIMMHEYGHIYLGHMDGIYEELDTQICNVFRDHRGELIERINSTCGIDFADKLIERVIDDPVLNHSLHNIAMDMEVNSSVLSKDDIEEMEMDITSIMPKYEEELLKYMIDNETDDEAKKALEDQLNRMSQEAKIKLILPCRYHMAKDDQGNEIPFPDDLTYAEYLLLIVSHLDQFVKMLVSIQMGGNGDTSNITQQDIQNALNNMKRNWANKSEEYKKGYNDALQDYKNGKVGKNPNNQQQNNQQGNQGQQNNQQGNQQQNNQQGNQGQQNNQQNPNSCQQGNQQGSQTPQSGQNQQGNQSGNNSGNCNSSSNQGNSSPQGQRSSDYEQGYNDALNDIANSGGQGGMQSLSDYLNNMGMSNSGNQGQSGNGKSQSPYQGERQDYTKDNGENGAGRDHRSESRDEADEKRKLGQIKSGGGVGCGNFGGPDATRLVDREVDEVDMALREVMLHVRSRVIKQDTRKDIMRLYNRGIVRSVIAPTVSRKVTISNDPKIVYLIDISGSMNTTLVDRILKSIANNMKKLSRGLKYDIITWSTCLGEHLKDIDPRKSIPEISMGGGTSIAGGIRYFKDNYGPEAVLIVISDFEDYLQEWHKVESTMPNYTMYGFNYGDNSYSEYDSDKIEWSYMKIRKFDNK